MRTPTIDQPRLAHGLVAIGHFSAEQISDWLEDFDLLRLPLEASSMGV
jgi:hypothetical protein